MPNGGTDNCGLCGFNKANGGKWAWPEDKRAFEKAYCTIRNVPIPNPLWTYCANWHTKSEIPYGPIFTSGLHEKKALYRRIPWHGKNCPQHSATGACVVCHNDYENGLLVEDEGSTVTFCSNDHYLDWWKQRHPDCPLQRPVEHNKRSGETVAGDSAVVEDGGNRVFYRILSAAPGYSHPMNYLLGKYRTLEYKSHIEKVKNADGSFFYATIEEARKAMPASAIRLPFEPDGTTLELWESSELMY